MLWLRALTRPSHPRGAAWADRVFRRSGGVLPVMARRTSRAASSRASTEACSLYQDVWGVQIRLGASFSGPVEKLQGRNAVRDGEGR